MSHEHFMNILTHWTEEDHRVDIEVGAAVAEVLQTEVMICTSNSETITFKPRTGPAKRTIRIQEIRNGLFVPVDSFVRLCDSYPISTEIEHQTERQDFCVLDNGFGVMDNGSER